MANLNYNIFSNISDSDYILYKQRLIELGPKLLKCVRYGEWQINDFTSKDDGLSVGIKTFDGIYNGGLGVSFEDKPDILSFSLNLGKDYDVMNRRYYLFKSLYVGQPLEFYETNIQIIVDEATKHYYSWSRQDIVSLGSVVEIS